MDLFTQGLMGACTGFAVLGRSRPRLALGLGFALGLIPDADVLLTRADDLAYFTIHRGLTHSLFFGPVVAIGLAWMARRFNHTVSYAHWWLFFALCLVTHPLIDAITVYGTQLFYPFDDTRYGWAALPIIDPVYSLPLLVACLFAWFSRNPLRAGSVNLAALVISSAYVMLAYAQNDRAISIVRADLAVRGEVAQVITANNTMFTPWLRRVMVPQANGDLHVTFVSTLAPQPLRWHVVAYDPAAQMLAASVAQTDGAQVFATRFQTPPKLALVHSAADGTRSLRLLDARYGFPGDTLAGIWGVTFPLDAQGRASTEGKRFFDLERPTRANVAALLRATFGLEQIVF